MNKISVPIELDSINGNCSETFESILSYNINLVNRITNPYVGNKKKILYWVFDTIQKSSIEYNTILDLFSGSGCISMTAKMMGKKVYSNDLLESSYAYTVAFVENNNITLSDDDIDYIINNKNDSFYGFVQKNFNSRFTLKESKFLDNFRFNVENRFGKSSNQNFYKYYLCYANIQLFIMDHCFVGGRLNNGQILADVEHRLQHARNNGSEMNFNNIKWKYLNIDNKDNEFFTCHNLDAINFLQSKRIKNKIDLIYIDPPYGKEMSDYSKMYSFFEAYISGTMDFKNDNSDNFTNSEQYKDNFKKVIELCQDIPNIVVSINNDSFADIEEILNIVKYYRKNVELKSCSYGYKYRKSGKTNSKEYLIIGR
jgi:adenine-specific DNA methylase